MEFNYTDEQLLAMTADDVHRLIRSAVVEFTPADLERWWYVHHWDN